MRASGATGQHHVGSSEEAAFDGRIHDRTRQTDASQHLHTEQ